MQPEINAVRVGDVAPSSVSRSSLMDRWRHEGRWEEIDAERCTRLRQLRTEGLSKADAQEAAWAEMAAKYPPVEAKDPPTESKAVGKLAEYEPNLDAADYIPGVEWVYRSIRTTATVDDAPDPGAAGLLEWARNNSDAFYKQVWPQAMALKAKQGQSAADDEALEEVEDCESIAELLSGLIGGEGFPVA